jgi:hypothetical protein
MSHPLTDVTAQCTFDFFAPHTPVGQRLQAFVAINPATGLVTPLAAGTNLVQVRVDGRSIVFRIQVHDTIHGWWFGHSSITTALDPNFGHTLPSIYALFSDDDSGTDLVGDISGHGYVHLQSDNPSAFVVAPNGRLRGVAVTSTPATLTGSFLSVVHQVPVRVVDYARPRQTLTSIRSADRSHPENVHNILFLAEGFRAPTADRKQFDEVVSRAVERLFSSVRHAPYDLLRDSFNIWKAYEPSIEHALTCGFRVNDEQAGALPGVGYPIPPDQTVVPRTGTNYAIDELIPIVGLPRRNQTGNAATLRPLWSSQSLHGFQPDRVDEGLVTVWKAQKSVGILEARDTFFGLHLGARYADRFGDASPVLPPAQDHSADPRLAPFVRRVYEWFSVEPSRALTPDPRRHPPELFRPGTQSLGNSILAYIRNQHDAEAPHAPVGREWMPDTAPVPAFRRSRGLIAIISNESTLGGANFNALTITASSVNTSRVLPFNYFNAAGQRLMRRAPDDPIALDLQSAINAISHEFGHTFNLDDEAELVPIDDPNVDTSFDNVTSLTDIQLDADFLTNRRLDPDKVKWLKLPRLEIADTLAEPSQSAGTAQMRVRIDPGQIGKWVEAQFQGLEVSLRTGPPADRRQLPMPTDGQHVLERLAIVDTIDEASGTILLGGPQMPAAPPVFPAGSLLFIPKLDPESGLPLLLVERKVLDFLRSTHLPLNRDPDRSRPNFEKDVPLDVPGFKPPCKRHRLIGVYEGAVLVTGMVYRPAGLCKMKMLGNPTTGDIEFCHVCKYLIVNRVNPALHPLLDAKHYPTPKKRDA